MSHSFDDVPIVRIKSIDIPLSGVSKHFADTITVCNSMVYAVLGLWPYEK
jgi:hypothetical protein